MGLFRHKARGGPRIIPEPVPSTEQQPVAQALHYSAGKPGVDQIPPEVILEWGGVYSYGERKYARDNWKKGNPWHEFYGSLLRHAYRWWQGEDIDPESGQPHLAHVIWNAGALRYFQLHGLGLDDRDVDRSVLISGQGGMSRYADKNPAPADLQPASGDGEVAVPVVGDAPEDDAGAGAWQAPDWLQPGGGDGQEAPTPEAETGEAEPEAEPGTDFALVPVTECWCDMEPIKPHAPHLQMQDLNDDQLALRLYVIQQNGLTAFVGPVR